MWEVDYLDKSFKPEIQNIQLTKVVDSTFTVISVSEIKNYLKISTTVDDLIIDQIIKSSTKLIEHNTQNILTFQSWKQQQQGNLSKIVLNKNPIIGTPTVTVYDSEESTGENFTDFRIVGNILFPTDGYFYKMREGDGYTIEFDCGLFTSTTTSNNDIDVYKNIICRISAFLFENRQTFLASFNEENWSVSYNLSDLPKDLRILISSLSKSNLGLL